jgi:uncharacterized membrane protein YedE/YeeE
MTHTLILTFFTLSIAISHIAVAQEVTDHHQLSVSSDSSNLHANELNDRIQYWNQRVERTRKVRNVSGIAMVSGAGIAGISAIVLALSEPNEDLHLDDSMYFFVGSFFTGCGVAVISAVPFIAALVRHRRSKRQLDKYLEEKALTFTGISVGTIKKDHFGLAFNFTF